MRAFLFGLISITILFAAGCGGPNKTTIDNGDMMIRYDYEYHNYDIQAQNSRVRLYHSKIFFTTNEGPVAFDDPDLVKTLDIDRFSDVRGDGDLMTVTAKDPWKRHDITMLFKLYDDQNWASVEMRVTNTSREDLPIYTLMPLNIQPEFGGGMTIHDEAIMKSALVKDFQGNGEHLLPFKDMKNRQGIYSWESMAVCNPQRELTVVLTNLTEENMLYYAALDQAEDKLRGPPLQVSASLLTRPSGVVSGDPYSAGNHQVVVVAPGATLSSGEMLVCLVEETVENLAEFVNRIPR